MYRTATVAPEGVYIMPELVEVEQPTRKTFVSRPNSNADKIEKEEEELDKLLKEQESTEEDSGHVIEDDDSP